MANIPVLGEMSNITQNVASPRSPVSGPYVQLQDTLQNAIPNQIPNPIPNAIAYSIANPMQFQSLGNLLPLNLNWEELLLQQMLTGSAGQDVLSGYRPSVRNVSVPNGSVPNNIPQIPMGAALPALHTLPTMPHNVGGAQVPGMSLDVNMHRHSSLLNGSRGQSGGSPGNAFSEQATGWNTARNGIPKRGTNMEYTVNCGGSTVQVSPFGSRTQRRLQFCLKKIKSSKIIAQICPFIFQ